MDCCCWLNFFVHTHSKGYEHYRYNFAKKFKIAQQYFDVGEVYSDYKVRLVKDVREALGVKAGDKLVWIKVDGGCFVAKRVIDDSGT